MRQGDRLGAALVDIRIGVCAQVRRIELSRTTASGAVAPEFVSELLGACELEGVAKLRCAEGMLPAWQPELFSRLDGLRVLNLSSCGLSALPPGAALYRIQRRGSSEVSGCHFAPDW